MLVGHARRGDRLPAQAGDWPRRSRPSLERVASRAGARRQGGTAGPSSRASSTPSTAPRAARAPPRRPPTSPSCSTGSPASGRCSWIWTSSWARSRCCSGVQPRFNFVDMVQNFHRMDAELLASYIERHDSGRAPAVGALPARRRPRSSPATRSGGSCTFLRKHYDYVVVDTAKSFSPATLAAFEQADLAFLVTNVDLASLRNIQRGLPLLKRMLGRSGDHVRLIVNRYNSDERHLARGRGAHAGAHGVPHPEQRLRGREPVDQHRQAHRAQRQFEVQRRTCRRWARR